MVVNITAIVNGVSAMIMGVATSSGTNKDHDILQAQKDFLIGFGLTIGLDKLSAMRKTTTSTNENPLLNIEYTPKVLDEMR